MVVINVKGKGHQGALLRERTAHEELRQHVSVIGKNEQRLAALNAISSLITQSLEIRRVLPTVAKQVAELMNVDAIMVFLLDDEGEELLPEAFYGVTEEFVAGLRGMKVGEGFNGTVARTGRPLLVDDATNHPLLNRRLLVAEGIRSRLIVPLQSKGRVMGTLCGARRMPGEFHADEVALLSSIGNAIGAVLENGRLYQDMEQALTQLRQSEERYRALFENASDAIWLHDLKGNMLAANMACEKVSGHSLEELHKESIDRMMSDCSKSCISEIEHRLLRGEPVDHRCEVELLKKGGGRALVQVTTSLITHEGKAVGFQHCAQDVTDERRLQENLRYYLQQVTRAQEEERKRIARELHDETLQNLVVISRQLDKITSHDALWEESLEVVRSFKKQIEVVVQELRRFSRDLRPSVLDDLGLMAALESLADDLNTQGIATGFKVIGQAGRLSPEAEVMLFRIAQEATRNIRRHAGASAAELVIDFRNTKVRLSIRDNGKGFGLPQRLEDLASLGKFGLAGMQERARLLGGTLTMKSKKGEGTRVTAEVRV
ncbi:MAG: PAS domain S-box protein [Chloroflexota bacterium]